MSTPKTTFAAQGEAVRTLAALDAAFGHLPAPTIQLARQYPDRLHIGVYEDLAAFERWREALGADPAAVTAEAGGCSWWLTVTATWGGTRIKLTGFAATPAPVCAAA